MREIREELAVHIEVGDLIGRGEASLGVTRIVLDVYAGAIAHGEPEALQHAALAWCGSDELDVLAWAPTDVPIVGAVQALLRAAWRCLGGPQWVVVNAALIPRSSIDSSSGWVTSLSNGRGTARNSYQDQLEGHAHYPLHTGT